MKECEKEEGPPINFLVVQQGTILQKGPWPDSDVLELNYPALLREVTDPVNGNSNRNNILVEIVAIGKESQKIPPGIYYLPTP